MRAVRSKWNRSTEKRFLDLITERGIKDWTRGDELYGKPDFVFPSKKLVVFIDGCFWHGHSCKKIPETNKDYWKRKIERNKARDAEVTKLLQQQGWKVERIWECELKPKHISSKVAHIIEYLSGKS